MSDIGQSTQMKPQDTTIFLLGQITEGIKSLREGQAASQLQQAERDARNERDHDEFRRTLGTHGEDLAVLKEDRRDTGDDRRERTQRFMAYYGGPLTAVIAAALSYIVGLITHP